MEAPHVLDVSPKTLVVDKTSHRDKKCSATRKGTRMHFHNSTPHIVSIHAIDIERSAVMASLGMIPPMMTSTIPIELTDPDGRKHVHEGDIIIRTRRGRRNPGSDEFVIGLKASCDRRLHGAPVSLRFSCILRPRVGEDFAFEVPQDTDLNAWRTKAAKTFGRQMHIRAMIGPVEHRPDGMSIPIKAVDDPFLVGNVNRWPQRPGHLALIGRWK